jgi:hypothetical protein
MSYKKAPKLRFIDAVEVTNFAAPGDHVDLNLDGNDGGNGVYSVAVFSEDRRYRMYLRRVWDPKLPRMAGIFLNPSTADAFKNDPTVARFQERATRLGFGSFCLANIFAYRSTQPNALTLPNVEPIGARNDEWIVFAATEAEKVLIGWGNHGRFNHRSDNVIGLLEEAGIQMFCLDQNKGGCPIHPLYQSYAKPLRRYMHSVI